jgi:hypothetical protein
MRYTTLLSAFSTLATLTSGLPQDLQATNLNIIAGKATRTTQDLSARIPSKFHHAPGDPCSSPGFGGCSHNNKVAVSKLRKRETLACGRKAHSLPGALQEWKIRKGHSVPGSRDVSLCRYICRGLPTLDVNQCFDEGGLCGEMCDGFWGSDETDYQC